MAYNLFTLCEGYDTVLLTSLTSWSPTTRYGRVHL